MLPKTLLPPKTQLLRLMVLKKGVEFFSFHFGLNVGLERSVGCQAGDSEYDSNVGTTTPHPSKAEPASAAIFQLSVLMKEAEA
jgi:hypothetical protein